VRGNLKFSHFGDVDSGVDMRGEVGLLSRNIIIQGEMEESCYGDLGTNCAMNMILILLVDTSLLEKGSKLSKLRMQNLPSLVSKE
jgi:hypothetical protein